MKRTDDRHRDLVARPVQQPCDVVLRVDDELVDAGENPLFGASEWKVELGGVEPPASRVRF